MKKALKVTGVVFALLLIAALALAFWQRGNIASIIDALENEPEKIAEKIIQKDKALKKELETYIGKQYREYTEEEKEAIESGEISEREVLAKIIAEASGEIISVEPNTETSLQQNSPAQSATPQNTPNSEEIVNRYAAKLYSMEKEYISGIEGILATAHAEYVKMAKHEKDMTALSAVGSKYIKEIYALESKCDGEVETLLANLKAELQGVGADTSIVNTMRDAYEDEKQLKRSQYMKKYMN